MLRKTRESIIDKGVRRLDQALSLTPRFPEAREAMGEVRALATFAHPGQLISREVWGNHVWMEILVRSGFANPKPASQVDRSVEAPGFLNMPYSYGNPHSEYNPHPPGYHKIALGKMPRILDADRPYFVQELSKSIDFDDIHKTTLQAFGSSEIVAERLGNVVDALRPLQFSPHAKRSAIDAALESRRRLMNIMGLDHVREEVDAHGMLRRFANVLRIMAERYEEPFWKAPIGGALQGAGGYLKAIGSNGKRVPVTIEDGVERGKPYPIVSYTDPVDGRKISFRGEEVYDAMADGKLVPTMVTIVFLMAATQVPQLGGRDMHEYAPKQLLLQGRALGLDRDEVTPLLMTTFGYDIFQLAYTHHSVDRRTKPPTKSEKQGVTTHVPPALVVFGSGLIKEALRGDSVLRGTYGQEGGRLVDLKTFNAELAKARRMGHAFADGQS
jgi:hypothetical protein